MAMGGERCCWGRCSLFAADMAPRVSHLWILLSLLPDFLSSSAPRAKETLCSHFRSPPGLS